MAGRKEKLLIGPKVRRLRETLGLTQTQMAKELDISTSYLNLIERNQRPMSAAVLLRLAQVYDFDISELSTGGDTQLTAELHEVMRDPRVSGATIAKGEIEDVVNASPAVAKAFLQLYERYREGMRRLYSEANPLADREKVELLEEAARSVEVVRDFFTGQRNYFPALDEAAEAFSKELLLAGNEPHVTMTNRLKEKHGLQVRILPVDVMQDKLRYFDRHRSGIDLSELLPQSGRRLQLAVQLGMLEYGELIDQAVRSANLPDRDAIGLARASLAKYFAAAMLMPYSRFLKECESVKYDIELLSNRFGTSYEQTAHRLTTLQKPDARGIPFFFVRMDTAGNVSKRFSAGRFPFSKFGGTCPLWNIHECFETPGKLRTQIVRMQDDSTWFSIARTVSRADSTYDRPATKHAIGLGCDIAYAPRLVYASHHNLNEMKPTPIGVNCYLCERQNCTSRAHAPLNKKITFDERAHGISLYRFEE